MTSSTGSRSSREPVELVTGGQRGLFNPLVVVDLDRARRRLVDSSSMGNPRRA